MFKHVIQQSLLLISLSFSYIIASLYRFPNSNHFQEVPAIQELCFADIFTHDFAIESFLGFGPRFFYNHLVCSLTQLGLPIYMVYLLLHLVAVISTLAALTGIARYLFFAQSKHTLLISGAMTIAILLPVGYWDAPFLSAAAIPATFAMAFVSWGLFFALKNNFLMAYALFGLGALLQFLVGFLPGLIFCLAALLSIKSRSDFTKLVLGIGLWGIALALVYIPMTLQQPYLPREFTQDIFKFFGNVRVPHHWLPSAAPTGQWINITAGYVGALILLTSSLKSSYAPAQWRQPQIRFSLYTLVLGSGLLLLTNYVGVEIYFIEIIGKLQFQRIMPFGRFAVYIIIYMTAYLLWQQQKKAEAIAFMLLPLWLLNGFLLLTYALYLSQPVTQPNKLKWLIASLTIICASVGLWLEPAQSIKGLLIIIILSIVYGAFYYTQAQKAALWLQAALTMAIIGGFSLLYIFPHYLPYQQRINTYWYMHKSAQSDIEKLAQEARKILPNQSIVMLPPIPEFAGFAFYAQKPVYFSWKNVPYTAIDLQVWRQRLTALTQQTYKRSPSDEELEKAFAAQTTEYLQQLMQKEDITYIVSQQNWHFKNQQPLIQSGKWALWAVDNAKF